MVETYGRVKGIEADVVLIYNVDGYLDYLNTYEKMTVEQKMRSVFSAVCRARSHVHIHGFNDSGFYSDLKESYHRCLKRRIIKVKDI